jgi:Transposase DDE domain
MPRPDPLYQWTQRVATRFPELPRPTAAVLALYSYGAVPAQSCAVSAVALALAALRGPAVNTVRQRLRELYQPAARKAGRGRTELDPAVCSAPLLRWAVAGFGAARRLAVALDVTNLGDRFHVLCCSVVFRGCGVPVAWAALRGNAPAPWTPHWAALLGRVAGALGPGWEVVVLTDRGLESAALFRHIAGLGWHPLMRAKAGGTFRPAGWARRHPMGRFAARPGQRFAAAGVAYRDDPLPCTLLAEWRAGGEAPWLLLTDLPPAGASAGWYAWRAWVEQNFKVVKSAGWQWQRTRMADPERAARLWAVVALATLWLVEVGGLAEQAVPPATVPRLPKPPAGRPRVHRLFRLGLAVILAGLLRGELMAGTVTPEPWPAPDPPAGITEENFLADLTYP